MTMDFKKTSAGVITMMALMGNAYAATTACPAVTDIKQTTGEYGGFAYTAPAPNGLQWTGENPMADEADLKSVTFKMASIHNDKNFVACDYEGKGKEGMRMALKTTTSAKPTGTAWKGQECAGTNPALCTFE